MHDRLLGKVALVTGASRGIGKGIAQTLLEQGATVYITGRKHNDKSEYYSVKETADELNLMKKGKCIAVICDHKNDSETQKVFDLISEKEKKLDILVNNAFAGLDLKVEYSTPKFWENNPNVLWEKTIDIGLRSSYVASCLAIRMMVNQKSSLIVNISSIGGLFSLFNPVYGIGKEATDRMSVELGHSLKKYNISVVSLWPGLVRTETMQKIVDSESSTLFKKIWHLSESTFLTGRAIVSLATDSNIMSKTARVHVVAELAYEYGFTDIDGKRPASLFALKNLLYVNYSNVANWIPSFIYVPKFICTWYYSKF